MSLPIRLLGVAVDQHTGKPVCIGVAGPKSFESAGALVLNGAGHRRLVELTHDQAEAIVLVLSGAEKQTTLSELSAVCERGTVYLTCHGLHLHLSGTLAPELYMQLAERAYTQRPIHGELAHG